MIQMAHCGIDELAISCVAFYGNLLGIEQALECQGRHLGHSFVSAGVVVQLSAPADVRPPIISRMPRSRFSASVSFCSFEGPVKFQENQAWKP